MDRPTDNSNFCINNDFHVINIPPLLSTSECFLNHNIQEPNTTYSTRSTSECVWSHPNQEPNTSYSGGSNSECFLNHPIQEPNTTYSDRSTSECFLNHPIQEPNTTYSDRSTSECFWNHHIQEPNTTYSGRSTSECFWNHPNQEPNTTYSGRSTSEFFLNHPNQEASRSYSKEVSGNPVIPPHLPKFHGILNGVDQDILDLYDDEFIPERISPSKRRISPSQHDQRCKLCNLSLTITYAYGILARAEVSSPDFYHVLIEEIIDVSAKLQDNSLPKGMMFTNIDIGSIIRWPRIMTIIIS